jgi:inhibitor of cysteine peptidase
MRLKVDLFVFLLLLFVSCTSLTHIKKDKNINRIEVKKQEIFSINLKANSTTGYDWVLDASSDTSCIMLVKKEYKSNGSSEIPTLGVGGEEIWQFRALKKGESYLLFNYLRSWENKAPIDSIKYLIKIK